MTQDDYNEYAEGYEAGKEAAQETGLSNTAQKYTDAWTGVTTASPKCSGLASTTVRTAPGTCPKKKTHRQEKADFAADIVESAPVPAAAGVHWNLGRRSATPTGGLTAWLTSPMRDCHRSLKFPERAGRAPASPAHPRSRHQNPSSPNRSPTWPRRFGVYSLLRVGDTGGSTLAPSMPSPLALTASPALAVRGSTAVMLYALSGVGRSKSPAASVTQRRSLKLSSFLAGDKLYPLRPLDARG
jgi:hypothetical protein